MKTTTEMRNALARENAGKPDWLAEPIRRTTLLDLLDDFAELERERDDWRSKEGLQYQIAKGLKKERDAARAEVERLREALKERAPWKVFKLIRLTKDVRADLPWLSNLSANAGAVHEPRVNPHGAVSINIKGEWLGVKPDEFEWIE